MNGEEKPIRDFKKFQTISYEFGTGMNLFRLTKNFGSDGGLIIADKKNNSFVKIPTGAMSIFMSYLNQLYTEKEKL